MPGDLLRTSPHTTLRVLESTPETLLFEADWEPGSHVPPAHLHPFQDERFEILEGELEAVVDGEARTLRAGETLEIPAATAHQMWNAGATHARATWRVTPPRRTEQFFRDLASGAAEEDGMAFLERYAAEFRLAR
jgi:mannose-6-phosphate isomerase-like protein (cupin superfamily)